MSCCATCRAEYWMGEDSVISVVGSGPSNTDVAIVGIAPGSDEWKKTHKPFTGPAGKLMSAMLSSCDLEASNYWLSNLLCWWNDEPTPSQVAECFPRLREELLKVKPKLIITIGIIPFQAFFGQKAKMSGKHGYRGVATWFEEYNCYIMPTYHPSACLQGHYQYIHDIIRDFKKIPLILNWKTHDKEGEVSYEVIDTRESAVKLLANLPHDTFVALDIECNPVHTDTTDPFSDPLLCLSINYNGKHSYIFTGASLKEWQLDWPTDILWTYQFGQYDIMGLERELGIKLPLVHDTGIMSYALDERTPRERDEGGATGGIHGLKQNAREYSNSGWYELPVQQSWKTGVFDDDTLFLYNGQDSAYTYRRANFLYPQLKDDGVESLYNNLLMPAARVFAEIAYRGVPFDIKTTAELLYDWSARLGRDTERLVEFAQELGYEGTLNLSSPQQVSKFLYQILGVESPLAPSVSADALDLVDHIWVDQWQDAKHLEKFIGTYLLGTLDDLKPDMLLHPEVLLHGTSTGRTSYVNPPVQTTPKHVDGELAKVRLMFCAQNDDYIIAEADYSSAEMWVMAYQCEDNTMLRDLNLGDFHRRTAGRVLNKPFEEVTDYEKTYIGKKINFGIPYGIGAKKLSNRRTGMGCTEFEAQEHLANWHRQYDRYRPWVQKLYQQVKKTGEIQTPTGRKRRFRIILDPKQQRQLTNFMVQSPAGDYTLTSVLELHELLKQYQSYIMFIVHDSIVFQLHKKYLHITLPLIAQVMEAHKWDGFPDLKTSITIGPNWLEQTEVRKDGKWHDTKLNLWQVPA